MVSVDLCVCWGTVSQAILLCDSWVGLRVLDGLFHFWVNSCTDWQFLAKVSPNVLTSSLAYYVKGCCSEKSVPICCLQVRFTVGNRSVPPAPNSSWQRKVRMKLGKFLCRRNDRLFIVIKINMILWMSVVCDGGYGKAGRRSGWKSLAGNSSLFPQSWI